MFNVHLAVVMNNEMFDNLCKIFKNRLQILS